MGIRRVQASRSRPSLRRKREPLIALGWAGRLRASRRRREHRPTSAEHTVRTGRHRDVQIDWSASCPTARIWSVTTHAFHQDGSSANAVSTALIEEPTARRTHGLVLTMAQDLLSETFTITVTVTCEDVDTLI